MGLGNPSLGGGHILRQILKGDLLDPQFTLPPLSDIATQPVGSNACGCYIIHYMEQELKLFRGEWLLVWPEVGWKNWKLRLVTVVPKQLAEENALTQAAEVTHAKLESQRATIAEQKSKAEQRLSKLKYITTSAYSTAKKQLQKNSVRFTCKNLSQAAIHKVRLLEHAFGKCAKCRWQSGCLGCNAFKCLRYHLHSEAAKKAHKLPYLSTGLEDLEQLLKTPSTSSSSAVPAFSSS